MYLLLEGRFLYGFIQIYFRVLLDRILQSNFDSFRLVRSTWNYSRICDENTKFNHTNELTGEKILYKL